MQIALELAGCLSSGRFVRRIAIAAKQRLLHSGSSALCPFTASYAVAPLTETPTLFAFALALWALARFHERPELVERAAVHFCGNLAALLRPDGALVAVALAPAC